MNWLLLAQRQTAQRLQLRSFSFSFAGPRKLEDLINKEKMDTLPRSEVVDLWNAYHEGKDGVLGMVLDGKEGSNVLKRASKASFFIQPVFREDGFFTLVSQFQQPSHFLCAYLEDYKMDPNAASPLLTFSVFDDYNASKDLSLVRVDILNKSIADAEGHKIAKSLLANYIDEFDSVQSFNKGDFDTDDFISRMSDRWKQE